MVQLRAVGVGARNMGVETALIVAAIAILAVAAFVFHFGGSGSLLDQWASKNGYQIIRQEYRSFFKGPFFWTSTRGQTVYYAGGCTGGGAKIGYWNYAATSPAITYIYVGGATSGSAGCA